VTIAGTCYLNSCPESVPNWLGNPIWICPEIVLCGVMIAFVFSRVGREDYFRTDFASVDDRQEDEEVLYRVPPVRTDVYAAIFSSFFFCSFSSFFWIFRT